MPKKTNRFQSTGTGIPNPMIQAAASSKRIRAIAQVPTKQADNINQIKTRGKPITVSTNQWPVSASLFRNSPTR